MDTVSWVVKHLLSYLDNYSLSWVLFAMYSSRLVLTIHTTTLVL